MDASMAISGDVHLGKSILEALSGIDQHGACVAFVAPQITGGSLVAAVGGSPADTFAVGSISKALNGLIYSAMVADGTVSGQDTLGRFLPLGGSAAEKLTLQSLVTHTSGLPKNGGGRRAALLAKWRVLRCKDPQPESLHDLVMQIRSAPVRAGRFSYSNLGASALGHALAVANGGTYPDLITERLANPLACPSLYVPAPNGEERGGDSPSLSIYNSRQEPWRGEGYSPSGGIRASAEDMAVVIDAILNRPLRGWPDAFSPIESITGGDSRGTHSHIGAGWFIQPSIGGGSDLVWHNGFASGFSSAIILNLSLRTGIFASLRDGAMQIDAVSIALELLSQWAK